MQVPENAVYRGGEPEGYEATKKVLNQEGCIRRLKSLNKYLPELPVLWTRGKWDCKVLMSPLCNELLRRNPSMQSHRSDQFHMSFRDVR
jgi:hypothetical protein